MCGWSCSSNFNPRSPHGERLHRRAPYGVLRPISIHAPRTGSDATPEWLANCSANFNPRSPHGERRSACLRRGLGIQFQSTLPARGATSRRRHASLRRSISIHAPRTGSDWSRSPSPAQRFISIHAPRTGSDSRHCSRPCRPAISIHAPRTGSDKLVIQARLIEKNFNPRSPHGERLLSCDWAYFAALFQSTLPARGATNGASVQARRRVISIHAPRTGSDALLCASSM